MNLVEKYTRDSRRMLGEWRKEGYASQQFLADLRKHCLYNGISWRGTSLRSISMYSPVLSASRAIRVAYQFCNKPEAAIVAFVGYEAYDISSSSLYQNEEEVILVLQEKFNCQQVGWLKGIPVYLSVNSVNLSCSTQNFSFWEREVKFQIGLYYRINLAYAAAKLKACKLIGFCPIRIEEDFYHPLGDIRLSIYVDGSPENFNIFINKPERFREILIMVREDSLVVKNSCPELGFWAAVPSK